MNRSLHVLYLARDAGQVAPVEQSLRKVFDDVVVDVQLSVSAFLQEAEAGACDVFVADYSLNDGTGIDAWNRLEHAESDPPFVVLFDHGVGEAESIDAMRSGVSECIYSEDVPRLGYTVSKLLEVWTAQQARIQADAALAVSRNELLRLTQQLHARIDEERTAVSREIHDDIGGALAAVKFDLAWIGRRTTDESIRERVNQAVGMLQQALDASQRIMLSLRPAILDEGLVPALQWLVNAFRTRTGAEVSFRCNREALQVSPEIQTVAFSVVRESLTNIVKHAKATRVVIDVSDQGGVLTVEVTDDGVGLQPKALTKATSFGILGLRERAQSVGGWLDIGSLERGVSVTLTVPLTDELLPDILD